MASSLGAFEKGGACLMVAEARTWFPALLRSMVKDQSESGQRRPCLSCQATVA